MQSMDRTAKQELLDRLSEWRDQDEPLVEAIGNTLAEYSRVDSQDMARRVLDSVIAVLDREL
jgi:hypothetical protein